MLNDLRFALRQMARNPGYYGLIIFILALGIGANLAIFGKLNHALFRTLPCKDSDLVLGLATLTPDVPFPGVSYLDLQDYQKQTQVFEQIGGWAFENPMILRDSGEPTQLLLLRVTPELLSVFGYKPALGRGIEPNDCLARGNQIVIISYQLWKGRFNGRSDILGQSLMLDDNPYRVGGVLPREFWIPGMEMSTSNKGEPDATNWALLPLIPEQYMLQDRAARYMAAFGRLKSGTTIQQARVEMTEINRRLESAYPQTNRNTRIQLQDLHNVEVGKQKTALVLLFVAVTMVLLITCANVANLLLARTATREKEMAVRSALGACRQRMIRQLLTESLLLGIAGGLAGLMAARVGQDILNSFLYQSPPKNLDFQLDWRMMGYTLLISSLTALLFGMAPIWHVLRMHLNESLKETGWSVSTSRRKRRFQRFLVGAEITLSMVLLIGVGLLLRSLWSLLGVDPGFRPERVTYIMIKPSRLHYANNAQKATFYTQIQERVESIPGVERASLSVSLPMSNTSASIDGLHPEGRSDIPSEERVMYESIGPGYFETLGIPIRAGRDFIAPDRESTPRVAIVNEALARKYWGHANPVGTRLIGGDAPITVVGVVGDTHHSSLETPAEPKLYFPYAQSSLRWWMFVVVRGRAKMPDLPDRLRKELRALDASLFISQPTPLQTALRSTMTDRHEMLVLIGSFAILALILTTSGLYGMLTSFVAQRIQEVGIRMALGARPGNLIGMIMRHAGSIVLVGLSAGTALSFSLSRYISSQLFGVTKNDPLTYVGVALLFLVVAAIAAYLPARRATKVDPMVALRYE
ncbi:MAG TPA: ABC transporter permease [Terriglobia bacterium]|nr:ABC transporter permease [Terriglobia bacterium]